VSDDADWTSSFVARDIVIVRMRFFIVGLPDGKRSKAQIGLGKAAAWQRHHVDYDLLSCLTYGHGESAILHCLSSKREMQQSPDWIGQCSCMRNWQQHLWIMALGDERTLL
jgi:hypothetical protein